MSTCKEMSHKYTMTLALLGMARRFVTPSISEPTRFAEKQSTQTVKQWKRPALQTNTQVMLCENNKKHAWREFIMSTNIKKTSLMKFESTVHRSKLSGMNVAVPTVVKLSTEIHCLNLYHNTSLLKFGPILHFQINQFNWMIVAVPVVANLTGYHS